MPNDEKIRFRNLSVPLKIAIIMSYVFVSFWGLFFIIAFMIGFISALQ